MIAWWRTWRANHRAFGWVSEDPRPRYSRADRADGRRHRREAAYRRGFARGLGEGVRVVPPPK